MEIILNTLAAIAIVAYVVARAVVSIQCASGYSAPTNAPLTQEQMAAKWTICPDAEAAHAKAYPNQEVVEDEEEINYYPNQEVVEEEVPAYLDARIKAKARAALTTSGDEKVSVTDYIEYTNGVETISKDEYFSRLHKDEVKFWEWKMVIVLTDGTKLSN